MLHKLINTVPMHCDKFGCENGFNKIYISGWRILLKLTTLISLVSVEQLLQDKFVVSLDKHFAHLLLLS